MGAGLARQFARKWPRLETDYKKFCRSEGMIPGGIHLWNIPYTYENGSKVVLNFATKDHWNNPSRIEWIDQGLAYLAKCSALNPGLKSLAIPPLGCGLGGLDWRDVRRLIENHLGCIEGLTVEVYEP